MRVRALDANGDMTFGQSQSNFLVNSSAAVKQIVQTRLLLFLGEWFLDTTDGTDWDGSVLGKYTSGLYDVVIQGRILGTQGVTGIVTGTYVSSVNSATRILNISCTVETQYSAPADIEVNFNVGQ
jgi:hypothetical protein